MRQWTKEEEEKGRLPQVEHSKRSIRSNCAKNIFSTGKSNIKDFFIVGNELSLRDHGVHIPNGAGGVDGTGADHRWLCLVPIEAS